MTGLRRSVNKSFMTDLFLKLGLGKPSLKIKTFKMENVETPGEGRALASKKPPSDGVGQFVEAVLVRQLRGPHLST